MCLVWSLALSQPAIAQRGGSAQGRIEGRIVRQDGGAGVGGVTVVVEELGRAELTDKINAVTKQAVRMKNAGNAGKKSSKQSAADIWNMSSADFEKESNKIVHGR